MHIYIISKQFACLSHNVPGWRRFASPNKGLRSKTRAGKMWWSKTPQRANSPTGVLRNPNRPNRAVSANRLLYAVSDSFIWFFFIFHNFLSYRYTIIANNYFSIKYFIKIINKIFFFFVKL